MELSELAGQYATLNVERLTMYGAALSLPEALREDVAIRFGATKDETRRDRSDRSGGPSGASRGSGAATRADASNDGEAKAKPPTVLLPRREVREDLSAGESLEVFIYFDSEDRLTATLLKPMVTLGEVAFLRVTSVVEFGAFVDWGLRKELLVPHAEQTRDLRVGERHAFGLFLDGSGRLAGTMRVAELLEGPGVEPHELEVGVWVEGESWRIERGLGLFVILERRRLGLLPEVEPHELGRGERARFRVAAILPDGKVRVSLRGLAHTHIADDADGVLEVLKRGAVAVGDHSDPEDIREIFGLSKKAFKRAVGRLLKAGRVELARDGTVVAKG